MKSYIITALFFLSFSVSSATLTVDYGIDILSLNGKSVEKKDAYNLSEGKNQIVAEFSARMRYAGKSEYISTPPYILTFDLNGQQDYQLKLKRLSFDKMKTNLSDKVAIFDLIGIPENQVMQEVLPPNNTFMPYSDIPLLVSRYNAEKGLPFGIVEYQEAYKVSSQEALNKLKYWYQQAPEEERELFKQWLASTPE